MLRSTSLTSKISLNTPKVHSIHQQANTGNYSRSTCPKTVSFEQPRPRSFGRKSAIDPGFQFQEQVAPPGDDSGNNVSSRKSLCQSKNATECTVHPCQLRGKFVAAIAFHGGRFHRGNRETAPFHAISPRFLPPSKRLLPLLAFFF